MVRPPTDTTETPLSAAIQCPICQDTVTAPTPDLAHAAYAHHHATQHAHEQTYDEFADAGMPTRGITGDTEEQP